MFGNLNKYLDENEMVADDCMLNEIRQQLTMLKEKLKKYFPDFDPDSTINQAIKSPFLFLPGKLELQSLKAEEEYIELINDWGNKNLLAEFGFTDFWVKIRTQYPQLCNNVFKNLVSFPTTYLCECAFSTLVTIKSKARNRLSCEADLRVALSKTKPHFQNLPQKKQHHPSH